MTEPLNPQGRKIVDEDHSNLMALFGLTIGRALAQLSGREAEWDVENAETLDVISGNTLQPPRIVCDETFEAMQNHLLSKLTAAGIMTRFADFVARHVLQDSISLNELWRNFSLFESECWATYMEDPNGTP